MVTTLILAPFLYRVPALCQSVPDSASGMQERARVLEREISSLEAKLAKAKRDWVTISEQLAEIEGKIMDCYMRIDEAEAELSCARRGLDSAIRQLYMLGRKDDLVRLLGTRDISDFLVQYDNLMDVTSSESDVLGELRDKKRKLEAAQDQLISFKQEAARLARSVDASAIEEQLVSKKKELADVSSQIIAMQLPATRTPAPSDFNPARAYAEPDENGFARTGQVLSGYSSWYGNEFHGRPAANGEVFDQNAFSCAHKTLPFGTWLRVTFKGRSVVVKVNDRGPFVKGRILDLSRGAAEAIGLDGVQWVDCEILTQQN